MSLVSSSPAENSRLLADRARTFLNSSAGTWTVRLGLLAIGLLWSYWPTFSSMAERWSRDPQYSHGFLVPIFALAVLWFRVGVLAKQVWQPQWFGIRHSATIWGLGFIGAATLLRLIAAHVDFEPLDAFSLLPMLAGFTLALGGWQALLWSWPAIAFLGFMLPLPFQLEMALAHPLRRLATEVSTYVLQTCGMPALSEGNVILIEEFRLGVVEACSGIGMLMTFFALATAMALVVRAPLWERLVLVGSAIPIAVIANVTRITVTAFAYPTLGKDAAQTIMHDLAGWFMMPLALGLLWLELKFLDRLFVETETARPLGLGLPRN